MATHSFSTLMRRLSRAGFQRQFITTALMPDWWDESCAHEPDLLPDIEVRVARFLGTPLAEIKNVEAQLSVPSYCGAQMRRVRDTDTDRPEPAIHAAIHISSAVIRNLRCTGPVQTPPSDPGEWRHLLMSRGHGPVQLDNLLADLWTKGIPVVPIDMLPTPSFQGLACIVDQHPVIVLGHNYDEPGRVAFFIAHEAGHIAADDCAPNAPVLHRSEGVRDSSTMERDADEFATRLLVGEGPLTLPEENEVDFRRLAQKAVDLESLTDADASSIIYAWAAKTLNYPAAAMAVHALYRSTGARRRVRRLFDQYVDLGSAGESDRALLRCVYGDPPSPKAAP